MKISYRARNSPPCANRSHCAHRAQRSPPARSWPRSGSGSSSVQPPALGRGGRRRRGRGGGERDPRPLPASPGGRRCPANAAVPLRAPVTSRRGDLVVPRSILQREKARSGASPARSLLSFRRNFFPRRLFHSFAYSVRVKTGKFHLKILKKRKRRPAATKRDHALPLAPGAAPPRRAVGSSGPAIHPCPGPGCAERRRVPVGTAGSGGRWKLSKCDTGIDSLSLFSCHRYTMERKKRDLKIAINQLQSERVSFLGVVLVIKSHSCSKKALPILK